MAINMMYITMKNEVISSSVIAYNHLLVSIASSSGQCFTFLVSRKKIDFSFSFDEKRR